MGVSTSDFKRLREIAFCPEEVPVNSETIVWGKTLDETTVIRSISPSGDDLLLSKRNAPGPFSTAASTVMGSWYDDLSDDPESEEGDEQENYRQAYLLV